MGNKTTLRAAVLAALALPLAAQAEKVSNEELLKRLEEQDQKILVLERKLEIQDEAAASSRESTPVVSAGPKGFSLQSADGRNQLSCAARCISTGAISTATIPAASWTASRRPACVRPSRARSADIYDFKLMPDFGQGRTVIQDAYVTARFNPLPS